MRLTFDCAFDSLLLQLRFEFRMPEVLLQRLVNSAFLCHFWAVVAITPYLNKHYFLLGTKLVAAKSAGPRDGQCRHAAPDRTRAAVVPQSNMKNLANKIQIEDK